MQDWQVEVLGVLVLCCLGVGLRARDRPKRNAIHRALALEIPISNGLFAQSFEGLREQFVDIGKDPR